MEYNSIYNPLEYSEVIDYYEMIASGKYDCQLPFVKKIEAFLHNWLLYSSTFEGKLSLQADMEMFASIFVESFLYCGLMFRGIQSGRKMPTGRLASWTPDFEIAVQFAKNGDTNNFPWFFEDANGNELLIASRTGEGFYLSEFLRSIVLEKSQNFAVIEAIETFLKESEIIACAYDVKYDYIREDEIFTEGWFGNELLLPDFV